MSGPVGVMSALTFHRVKRNFVHEDNGRDNKQIGLGGGSMQL